MEMTWLRKALSPDLEVRRGRIGSEHRELSIYGAMRVGEVGARRNASEPVQESEENFKLIWMIDELYCKRPFTARRGCGLESE